MKQKNGFLFLLAFYASFTFHLTPLISQLLLITFVEDSKFSKRIDLLQSEAFALGTFEFQTKLTTFKKGKKKTPNVREGLFLDFLQFLIQSKPKPWFMIRF